MGFFIVDHVLVDFIGDRDAVVFTTEIRNLLQFLKRKHLTERVVRGIYDNRFCVSRESILEFGKVVCKMDSTIRCRCLLQCDIDRLCPRDDRIRSVIFIKGFKDDNLVAGVDNCQESRKHTFS